MPKMKDSGVRWIGNIPYKWSINRLKYNIECFDGKRIPIDASLRVEGPYPYWGAGNITDYVDDYIFNEELVLLGEDGAPFFDEYRPVAFLVNEPIWVNNHIHVLRGNKNILNKFLTYFLNIVQYDVYINGSIINKLTQGNMNNINIVIPSIEEQRLITTFLDDKVGKTEEILKDLSSQIDILNKYKKSLITEIVTKGVNPNVELKDSGVDWIGKIPKKWKISKLKYIFIVGDEHECLAIKLNKNGVISQKSSLLPNEQDDVIEILKLQPEIKLNYKIIKQKQINNFKTRFEIENEKFIIDELNKIYQQNNFQKLNYLCLECFNKSETNINKAYIKLKQEIKKTNKNFKKLYNIFKMINQK